LWFDHHSSERERLKLQELHFQGASKAAPSAAQVVWDYYGGEATFGSRFVPFLEAVNKSDTASFTRREILAPSGWTLVSFIVDPRTGSGRFADFRISHLELMKDMLRYCRTMSAEEILAVPDVRERVDKYFEQQRLFEEMLRRCCSAYGNVIVTDLMDEALVFSGNRFLVYALFPEQNIEIRVMWGKDRQNVVFACGHSILNHTSRVNVGKLLLEYGGGGHDKVGTCQVAAADWERVLRELIEKMQ
jgi:nanoRNase/pAp phosphatase (c-di-AMP/oligoRNAs hydrolase)